MAKAKSRWEYVDALKLMVILGIVLNHAVQYKWNAYKYVTNACQNPALFFASGLIFSFCIADLGKYRSFREVLNKKARRLMQPYLLTAFLYYLPLRKAASMVTHSDDAFSRSVFRIGLDFLLGEQSDHLWFIYALFLVYLFFYPVVSQKNFAKNRPAQISLMLITFALNPAAQKISVNVFCLKQMMLYSVFFAGGYLCNLYAEDFFNSGRTQPRVICFGVAAVVTAAIGFLDHRVGYLPNREFAGTNTFRLLLAGMEIVKQFGLIYILFTVIGFLYRKTGLFRNPCLAYLSKNSFRIYLFHQPLVKVFLKLLPAATSDSVNFLRSVCIAVLSVVGALAVSVTVELAWTFVKTAKKSQKADLK